MISITHLGNESQLSSQYPAIEEFYQTKLKLHRISVTDRLFLSVLELPPPNELNALEQAQYPSSTLAETPNPNQFSLGTIVDPIPPSFANASTLGASLATAASNLIPDGDELDDAGKAANSELVKPDAADLDATLEKTQDASTVSKDSLIASELASAKQSAANAEAVISQVDSSDPSKIATNLQSPLHDAAVNQPLETLDPSSKSQPASNQVSPPARAATFVGSEEDAIGFESASVPPIKLEEPSSTPEENPLVAPVDFAPPPESKPSEQTAAFTNADIKSFWSPNTNAKDSSETLVIVPGRAENEHKYAELLYNLRNSGLRVVVCFVRGQGQSSNVIYGSTKCHVEYFANYRHDLETMLNHLNIGPNYKMMGFSLGGLISLDFCFYGTYKYKPKALGLISPFLGVHYPIQPDLLYWTIAGLCLFRSFALAYTPHGKEYKRVPFEENIHSHCMVRYNLYHDYYASHPQQAIAGPSFNFVKCCLRAQRKLREPHIKFNFPVMCLSSVLDKVVDFSLAKKFFESHQNDLVPPIFEPIEGAFHDVLNEKDEFRNPSLEKILNFLFPGSVHLVDPKAEQAALEAAAQAEIEKRMAQPLDMAEELPFDDDDDILESAEENKTVDKTITPDTQEAQPNSAS